MADYMSAFGYLAIQEEATFGTEPTWSPRYIDIVSETISHERGVIHQPGVGSRHIQKQRGGPWRISGGVDMVLEPENCGEILKWALGSVTTTQPDPTAAPNTYKHEFIPADDIKSFSMEIARGKVTALRYNGIKINSIEFGVTHGEMLTASLDLLGGRKPAKKARSTPTFSALDAFVFHQGVATIGGTDKTAIVREATITYANNLVDDEGAYGLKREMQRLPEALGNVEASVTLNFEDTAQLDTFLAENSLALNLKFESEIIESTYKYMLEINIPELYYDTESANISEKELIAQDVSGTALFNTGAGNVIKVILQNTISSY